MCSRLISLVILTLLAVGCSSDKDSSPDNPANDSTNEQNMPANDSVKELLQFSSTDDEQRFQCIYDQFSALAKQDGLTESDMQHFETDKLVSKQWCNGKGDKDSVSCQNPLFSGPLKNAGSQFMLLQTFVSDTYPEVTGTFESFGRNPVDESAWGIHFNRARNAPSSGAAAGDAAGIVSVHFSRINDNGEFQNELIFDQNIGYPFGAKPVGVTLPGNTLDDFTQLSASPEQFATTFEARYDVLQTELEKMFASGELADDTGNELSNALAFIEGQREIIRSDAPQLHALLTSGVDVSRCP